MHQEGQNVIESTDGYAEFYDLSSPGVSLVEVDESSGALLVENR